MTKTRSIAFYMIQLCLVVISCHNQSTTSDNSSVVSDPEMIPSLPTQTIDVYTALVKPFAIEHQLSGIISAHQKVELRSEVSGWLQSFSLREGDHVKKENIIAHINDQDLLVELEQLEVQKQKAENNRNERRMLVSGGDFGSDSLLTPQQSKYIDIESGYNEAVQAIKNKQHNLKKYEIKSPINGIVADINVKPGQWVLAGDPILTVIGPYSYEAEMMAVEHLALQLRKGQKLSLHSIADPQLTATANITTINPLVDDNGMVRIKAKLLHRHAKFMEGMHIEASIKTHTEPVIVIPKQAVVLRSGKSVVFTYDPESGLAKWNYVTIIQQNSSEAALSEGLVEGQQVIIEGNINLAHDAPVKLSDTQSEE